MSKPKMYSLRLMGVFVCFMLVLGASNAGAQKVTLRVAPYTTPVIQEWMKENIKLYMEEHPNIEVKIEIYPASTRYVEKAQIALATGTAADLIFTATGFDLEPFAAAGLLLPLDKYVEQDNYDLDEFIPFTVTYSKYNGKLYGLPYNAHSGLGPMSYNKDMFDEVGIAYPKEGWTYQVDVLEIAKKLTRDTDNDGKIDQYGALIAPPKLNQLEHLIPSFGGAFLNEEGTRTLIASPGSIAAVKYSYDLVYEYKVQPKVGTSVPGGFPQLFVDEKVAMLVTANYKTHSMDAKIGEKFRWGIAPAASGGAGGIHGHANPESYSIAAHSEHPDEAWEFLKFLASEESQRRFATEAFVFPALTRLATSEEFKNIILGWEIFYDAFKTARTIFLPANLRQREMSHALLSGLGPVWEGEMSAEEACKEVEVKINEILAKPRIGD